MFQRRARLTPFPALYLPPTTETSNSLVPSSAIAHASLFLASCAVGIGGLLCDCIARLHPYRSSLLHPLFAFLLLLFVAARFYRGLGLFGGKGHVHWNGHMRSSSRLIYLLLYALVATQVITDLAQGIDGSSLALNAKPCWIYVQHGLFAQVLLRALAGLGKWPFSKSARFLQ
jgi:hypothetical protein